MQKSKSLLKVASYCYIGMQYNKKTDNICIYLNITKRNRKREINRAKKARLTGRGIMQKLKSNGCAICGYNKCVEALEFHHTNLQDKNFLVNDNALGRKEEKLADEINKCILLCANCHRELHMKEKRK